MNVPFIDLKASYALVEKEIMTQLHDAISHTRFIEGHSVRAFEAAFATYCGVKHCIAVNSGTSALYLSLFAQNIGSGDEVILPVNTFIATAEAVSLAGATPVFVDVNPHTYLIDPAAVRQAVTEKTKAIIPVHLYGQCVDMDAMRSIASDHNLIVIEDACQAHGAEYKKQRTGSMGTCAAFSFYPGKNLGAWGEGGAITTNDDALADMLREIKSHGERTKYDHRRIGGNFRMDEFQGIILGVKLPYLDQWNEARRRHAQTYRQLLLDRGVVFQEGDRENVPVWHLCVIQVDNRDVLREYLSERGVGTGIHYPLPLHMTDAYGSLGYVEGDFPVAERIQKRIVSLPLYPEMTDDQIVYVGNTVRQALSYSSSV